jgi:hypothetical protein
MNIDGVAPLVGSSIAAGSQSQDVKKIEANSESNQGASGTISAQPTPAKEATPKPSDPFGAGSFYVAA